MKIVFIHQNFPAQFVYLARRLAADPANQVVAITERRDADPIPGVKRALYRFDTSFEPAANQFARAFDRYTRHGLVVRKALRQLDKIDFRPDLVFSHPGWGESMFVGDVFPDVPRLDYCEMFMRFDGILDFDPEEEVQQRDIGIYHQRTAMDLFCLETCAAGLSPTEWQRGSYPEAYRSKIEHIHEGIDLEKVKPDGDARVELPDGRVLGPEDEVVTYVARNLEPARGVRPFFRMAAELLERRPGCHVVVVGGDAVSYSRPLPGGQSHREAMMEEVDLDSDRFHYLGKLPYEDYLRVLQISSAHVYLTVPFVLSWSCLEAMAVGCPVVGSDTPPVREVVEDGENGLLADFFSPRDIADRVELLLDDPSLRRRLGVAARQTIADRFELGACLDRQVSFLERLAATS